MSRTVSEVSADLTARHADASNTMPMTAADQAAMWALVVEAVAAVAAEPAAEPVAP